MCEAINCASTKLYDGSEFCYRHRGQIKKQVVVEVEKPVVEETVDSEMSEDVVEEIVENVVDDVVEQLTSSEFISLFKNDHDSDVTYTLYVKGTNDYASDFINVHGRDATNCYRVKFDDGKRIFIWTTLDVDSMSIWAAAHGCYNIHEVLIDAFRYRFFLDIDLKVDSNYRWMSLFTNDETAPIAKHNCYYLTAYLATLLKLAIKSLKGSCKHFDTSYDKRNRLVHGKSKYSVHMFTNILVNKMSDMKLITEEMVTIAQYQLNYYSEYSDFDTDIRCLLKDVVGDEPDDDEFEAFLELVCQKQSIIDTAPYGNNKNLSISGSYKDGHRLIKHNDCSTIKHAVRVFDTNDTVSYKYHLTFSDSNRTQSQYQSVEITDEFVKSVTKAIKGDAELSCSRFQNATIKTHL